MNAVYRWHDTLITHNHAHIVFHFPHYSWSDGVVLLDVRSGLLLVRALLAPKATNIATCWLWAAPEGTSNCWDIAFHAVEGSVALRLATDERRVFACELVTHCDDARRLMEPFVEQYSVWFRYAVEIDALRSQIQQSHSI